MSDILYPEELELEQKLPLTLQFSAQIPSGGSGSGSSTISGSASIAETGSDVNAQKKQRVAKDLNADEEVESSKDTEKEDEKSSLEMEPEDEKSIREGRSESNPKSRKFL